MRILFVHAANERTPFNSSIAALAACVREAGHTPLLAVDAAGLDQPADVVAFSFMTCQVEDVRPLFQEVRRLHPGVPVLAGGPHPTTHAHATLAWGFAAVCVGEGEGPLLAWLDDPDTDHPGWVRHPDDPITRWWAPDVDALPDWDRALFPVLTNQGNPFEEAVGVAFSRGFCTWTCTFCGIDGYRRQNKQPLTGAVRLRSVERVLEEMERAVQTVDVPGFAVWDEVLPTKKSWIEAFAPAYRERIGLPLFAQARVEQIRPRVVEALVQAGCQEVVLGLECGDEDYRARVLDKRFTNEAALEAVRLLEDAGVHTWCSFLVGLPLETPAMLAKTVRLARDLPKSATISWKYYTPERGTRLFGLLERYDLVLPEHVDTPFGGSEPMIKLARCTREDLRKATSALEMLR